jgi:hypothetical protein
MSNPDRKYLEHPELGTLPAIQIIDCIFALAPSGRIIHLHKEQMATSPSDTSNNFQLVDTPALPQRSRCQIIPPFVNAFK